MKLIVSAVLVAACCLDASGVYRQVTGLIQSPPVIHSTEYLAMGIRG